MDVLQLLLQCSIDLYDPATCVRRLSDAVQPMMSVGVVITPAYACLEASCPQTDLIQQPL